MLCFRVPLRFTPHEMIFGIVFLGVALTWSGDSLAQESSAKEVVTPKSLQLEGPSNPVASKTTPAASEIAPQVADPDRINSDPPDKLTQKLIQDALQGKPVSARDPMFQDMLDVLRSRGSVLKGSMLDTAADAQNDDENQTKPVEQPFGRFEDAVEAPRENELPVDPRSENRFLTAEMLLRTARQLDKMAMSSPRRKRLVNQLRQEAVILLTEPARIRKAFRP